MKKIIFSIICLSLCFSAFCQEAKADDYDMRLTYFAGIGTHFSASRMGAEYNGLISDKWGMRIGASSTDFFLKIPSPQLEDKAPYSAKGKQMALKAAVDYKVSEKFLMSFSAYLSNMVVENSLFYTRAVNASFRYMFRENSFIDVSLTFVDTNNPFVFCNPYMPYHHSPCCGYGFNDFTSFWLP